MAPSIKYNVFEKNCTFLLKTINITNLCNKIMVFDDQFNQNIHVFFYA